jgi:hypothetical protein
VPRRVDIGALLAGAGALLLIVSLFLDWYEVAGEVMLSGWRAFEITDLVLTLAAIATLASVTARFGLVRSLPHHTMSAAGAAALVLVAVQLVNPPPVLAVVADTTIATGGWLGLSGAALMFAGGVFSLARVSISLSFEQRDREVAIRREQRVAATPAPPEPPREAETMPLESGQGKD